MGFPVGYTEVFFPNLFLHTLSLLGFIRAVIFSLFHVIGLSDLLETTDSVWPHHPATQSHSATSSPPISAAIIRDLLPIVRFSDLVSSATSSSPLPEGCAVCLRDFEGREEIRRLTNCRHVFHRECLDRWMDHDQDTCPLCRTSVVPDHLREDFNRRLWAASGASADFYSADF